MIIKASGTLGNNRVIKSLNRSFKIKRELNEKMPECTFSTLDVVSEWDEIIVTDNTLAQIYGGIVEKVEIDRKDGVATYNVKCAGYKRLLDRKRVAKSYTSQFAGDIIKDIIDTFTEGFTYTGVENGVLLTGRIAFNQLQPSECFSLIADSIGYSWSLGDDRDVSFYAKDSTAASESLTDGANFKDLKIEPDVSNFANAIILRGGTYESSTQTIEFVADGSQTIFNLPESPSDVTVDVDAGAGFVSKTVGIKFGEEPPTTEFQTNYLEKYIENGTHAVLSAGDIVKITYKYKVPIRMRAVKQLSINAMIALFPTTDGVFEKVIDDKDINSREIARQRMTTELDAYANAVITGSFTTEENTFNVGEILSINTDQFTGSAVIQNITAQNLGGDIFRYTIKFATVLFGFEDFLRDLYAAKKIEINENETVEIISGFSDQLRMSEVCAVSTDENRRNETLEFAEEIFEEIDKTVTYVWGAYYPSDFVTDNKRVAVWNLSAWQ